jgi:xylose isomerase
MTDYIISREWISELLSMHVSDARKREIRDMILTHPSPSPQKPTLDQIWLDLAEHDATIRNATLDEAIKEWIRWFDYGYERPIQKESVIKMLESLRGEP